MFYEWKHSISADYFTLERGSNLSFPPHIHHSFEIITVTAGEMQVTAGGKQYLLTPGYGVLVFPNQIHALTTQQGSAHRLCIFSPQLVSVFANARAGMWPENALFRLPPSLAEQLFALTPESNRYRIKGVLYSICGLFDEATVYREGELGEDEALLFEIFAFIERNFDKDCSLDALCAALAYSYAYLSKYFKRAVGQSYHSYVNQYRVREVCDRLDNTADSILKISEECGFRALRSMNRNFKEQTGMTPAEYRKRKH
ncbi:MAG: helix-turn-helix domain-containing protein [Ruminococcaceae bacterium]|nr:helix-turn-helix domain-containing protein [Oscillospiraceae bacterium]